MQDTSISDAILVERIEKGNVDAMNELVLRHQARAYRLALGLTKNHDQAADVVAEAFVRMFRSIHTFKGESCFATWTYRIVTNCFLDMRKRSKCRPAISLDQLMSGKDCCLDAFYDSKEFDPHSSFERSERRRAIGEKLDTLPARQKAMILLYHQEMMSYDEIATMLRMPIGTVKSRLNRARLKLRDALYPQRSLFNQPKGLAA